jgi:hypothetical protein
MQLLEIGQRKKNRIAHGGEAAKSKSPDIQLTGRVVSALLCVSVRYFVCQCVTLCVSALLYVSVRYFVCQSGTITADIYKIQLFCSGWIRTLQILWL